MQTKAAPPKAVVAATRYASGRLGLGGLSGVRGRSGRRKQDWALVTGSYRWPGSGGKWAVWLKLVDGYWLVQHASRDAVGHSPPAALKVPCDLRPAFAAPAC